MERWWRWLVVLLVALVACGIAAPGPGVPVRCVHAQEEAVTLASWNEDAQSYESAVATAEEAAAAILGVSTTATDAEVVGDDEEGEDEDSSSATSDTDSEAELDADEDTASTAPTTTVVGVRDVDAAAAQRIAAALASNSGKDTSSATSSIVRPQNSAPTIVVEGVRFDVHEEDVQDATGDTTTWPRVGAVGGDWTCLSGIGVNDEDVADDPYGVLTVLVTAQAGRLRFGRPTEDDEEEEGSEILELFSTGTPEVLNALLDPVCFRPPRELDGLATVSLFVSDNGFTGVGGNLTDTRAVHLHVEPGEPIVEVAVSVEDATAAATEDEGEGSETSSGAVTRPNSAPVIDTTSLDAFLDVVGMTALQVNAGDMLSVSGVQVSDDDVMDDPSGTLSLSVSVGHGSLNMGSTSDLYLLPHRGSLVGPSHLIKHGTPAQLNRLLATLRYWSTAEYHGEEWLDIEVADNGFSGEGGNLTASARIAIDVHGAAVDTASTDDDDDDDASAASAGNDTESRSETDIDAQQDTEEAEAGFDDGEDPEVEVEVDLRARPIVAVQMDDGGALVMSNTTTRQSPYLSTVEEVGLHISAISLLSSNSDTENVEVTVTMVAEHGLLGLILAVDGVTVTEGDFVAGSRMLSLLGLLPRINVALARLRYVPDEHWNGVDSLRLDVSFDDLGADEREITSVSSVVSLIVDPVNDGPALESTVPLASTEDVPLQISGVTVIDRDMHVGEVVTVRLRVRHGHLRYSATIDGLDFITAWPNALSRTLTLSGTLDYVNAGLQLVWYDPDTNWYGIDSLHIVVQIENDRMATSLDVNITQVLDPPVIEVRSGSGQLLRTNVSSPNTPWLSTLEDIPMQVQAISVVDVEDLFAAGHGSSDVSAVDANTSANATSAFNSTVNGTDSSFNSTDNATVAVDTPTVVEVSVSNGALALLLEDDSTVDWETGDVSDDTVRTLRITGGLSDVNDALRILQYTPDDSWIGVDTLIVSATLNDTSLSSRISVSVVVEHVNDVPFITVNDTSTFYTDEDEASAIQGVWIHENDAIDRAAAYVELEVWHGTLRRFDAIEGFCVLEGDTVVGSRKLVLQGDLDGINDAMAVLEYVPDQDWNGNDSFSLIATLSEDVTSVLVPFTVRPVEDTPVAVIDETAGAFVTNEDQPLVLTGISLEDPDRQDMREARVSVSVQHGLLRRNQLLQNVTAEQGDIVFGSKQLVLRGALVDVNIALRSLRYVPDLNWNGVDTFEFQAFDTLHDDIAFRAIRVYALNDPPELFPPNAVYDDLHTTEDGLSRELVGIGVLSCVEDMPCALGLFGRDVDAVERADSTVSVQFVTSNGSMVLDSNKGVDGITHARSWVDEDTGDTNWLITVQSTMMPEVLERIAYRGYANRFGTDQIRVVMSDQGNAGSSACESTRAIPATAVDLWAAVSAIGKSATSPISCALTDTVTIPVHIKALADAPIWNVNTEVLVVAEDAAVPISASITDVDSAESDIFVRITTDAGTLSFSAGDLDIIFRHSSGRQVADGDGASFIEFSADVDTANLALASLVFYPAQDRTTYRRTPDTVEFLVSDQGARSKDMRVGSDTATVYMHIIPVNDAPEVRVPGEVRALTPESTDPTDLRVVAVRRLVAREDEEFHIRGVHFDDVDARDEPTADMTVELHAVNGTVHIGDIAKYVYFFTPYDILPEVEQQVGAAHVVFKAPPYIVEAALADLHFLSDADYYGPASVTIRVSDNGNVGGVTEDADAALVTFGEQSTQVRASTVNLTHARTIPLEVSPINDPPIWHIPTYPVIVTEDTAHMFTDIVLADEDADDFAASTNVTALEAANATMVVELRTSRGTLSLADKALTLDVLEGSGEGDQELHLQGSLAQINAALRRLVYQPPLHMTSTATIKLLASDMGNEAPVPTDVVLNTSLTNEDAVLQRAGGVSRHTVSTPDAPFDTRRALATVNLLVVSGTNDAPRIFLDSNATIDEDTTLLLENLRIEDDDADETFEGFLRVTLTAINGSIEVHHAVLAAVMGVNIVNASTNTGVEDNHEVSSILAVEGTLATLNAFLPWILYRPHENFYGTDEIVAVVDDLGNTGPGGSQTASTTLSVEVTPVNDPAIIHVPDAVQTVVEDHKILIEGIYLTDADELLDLDGDSDTDVECPGVLLYRLRLSPTHGRVMLAREIGLEYEYDNTSSGAPPTLWWKEISVVGRLHDINKAVAHLGYWPDLNWNSHETGTLDEIELYVEDLWATAEVHHENETAVDASIHVDAGILVHTERITTHVSAVNDAPVLTVDGARYDVVLRTQDHLSDRITGVDTVFTDEDVTVPISNLHVRDVEVSELNSRGKAAPLTVWIIARRGLVSIDATTARNLLLSNVTMSSDLLHMVQVTQNTLLGELTEPGTVMAAQNQSVLAFRGNLVDLNRALATLTFTPRADYFGAAARVIVEVSDEGAYGTGFEQRDRLVIPVVVRAVNDAPQIITPAESAGDAYFISEAGDRIRVGGARWMDVSAEVDTSYATSTGYELWRSEGIRPVTDTGEWGSGDIDWRQRLVRDIASGELSSSPSHYMVYNDVLYFQAYDPAHGWELWSTDGTEQNTTMVKDIFPGARGSYPSYMVVFNGYLYFQASGIDTTWMLAPQNRDECGGLLQSDYEPRVFYAVSESNEWNPDKVYDCPYGYHWASTAEGYAFFPGQYDDHVFVSSLEQPTYLSRCGWTAYEWNGVQRRKFRFSDSHITGAYKDAGKRGSYRPDLDPTSSGTVTLDTTEFAGAVCVVGDPLFGSASEDLHDIRQRFADCRRMNAGAPEDACQLRAGSELWRSDGTERGTLRVEDVDRALVGSFPAYMLELDDAMLFAASVKPYGRELYRSTGKAGGSALVKDINKGHLGSNPMYLTLANDLVFFAADDGLTGVELHVTDGHLGFYGDEFDRGFRSTGGHGTRLVLDIRPGPASSFPAHLAASEDGDLLFFQASDGTHGMELWTTDGTRRRTEMVLDICDGAGGSYPAYMVAYRSAMYFQADDCIDGMELWRSDGTSSGTTILKDIREGTPGSMPSYLTPFTPRSSDEELLFFFATDGRENPELDSLKGFGGAQFWVTDGTRTGTQRAFQQTFNDADVDTEALDARWPPQMAVYDGALFYSSREGLSDVLVPAGSFLPQNEALKIGLDQIAVITDVDEGLHGYLNVVLACHSGVLVLQDPTGVQINDVVTAEIASDSHIDNNLTMSSTPNVFGEWYHWSTQPLQGTSINMTGTVLDINTVLRDVRYNSFHNAVGWENISITVSDRELPCNATLDDLGLVAHGGNGEAPSRTNGTLCSYGASHVVTETVRVYLVASNAAPTVDVPTDELSVKINDALDLSGMIVVNDSDVFETTRTNAKGESVTPHVTATVESALGVISLGALERLQFLEGNGVEDGVIAVQGELERIQAAFSTLEYSCPAFRSGCVAGAVDTVTISLNDNGYTGQGGALETSSSFDIELLEADVIGVVAT